MADFTIKAGVRAVAFTKVNGETFNINLAKLTQETVDNIFTHGVKQLCNDAASGVKDVAEARKKVLAMRDRLESNAWSPGSGGGAALSPFDREYRSIAVAALGTVGLGVADATKAAADAKTPPSRKYAILRLAADKHNGDVAKVTKADADAASDKVHKHWSALARKALEAKADLSIEL